MLRSLEKVQFGVSGLAILGAIGLHAWQGIEHWNKGLIDLVPIQAKPVPEASPSPQPGAPPAASTFPGPGKEPERHDYRIQREAVAYIKREANYLEELDKAGSEVLPGPDGRPTRLRLKDIDDDSLLRVLEFEEDDIIENIDGEPVEYIASSPADALEFRRRFARVIEKIEKGDRISIAITRKGRPMEIGIQL